MKECDGICSKFEGGKFIICKGFSISVADQRNWEFGCHTDIKEVEWV